MYPKTGKIGIIAGHHNQLYLDSPLKALGNDYFVNTKKTAKLYVTLDIASNKSFHEWLTESCEHAIRILPPVGMCKEQGKEYRKNCKASSTFLLDLSGHICKR